MRRMFIPRKNDQLFWVFWLISVSIAIGFFFGSPVSIVATGFLIYTVAPILGINQFMLVFVVVAMSALLVRMSLYYMFERPIFGDD